MEGRQQHQYTACCILMRYSYHMNRALKFMTKKSNIALGFLVNSNTLTSIILNLKRNGWIAKSVTFTITTL